MGSARAAQHRSNLRIDTTQGKHEPAIRYTVFGVVYSVIANICVCMKRYVCVCVCVCVSKCSVVVTVPAACSVNYTPTTTTRSWCQSLTSAGWSASVVADVVWLEIAG